MNVLFSDRRDAGAHLATQLGAYAQNNTVVVFGLPRGGVPVAYEVAYRLGAPLDVFLVRKLGVPGREELAMGAIASGGVRVLNEDVVANLHIPAHIIDEVAAQEQRELERREQQYRAGQPAPDVHNRIVILVDDGLATGATMRAAIMAVRQLSPARVVVAVPVAASVTCTEFTTLADEIVCAYTPEPFYAVGLWYADFSPTSDQEVRDLLNQAAQQQVT